MKNNKKILKGIKITKEHRRYALHATHQLTNGAAADAQRNKFRTNFGQQK